MQPDYDHSGDKSVFTIAPCADDPYEFRIGMIATASLAWA
jgi:hypothetical protein